MSALLDLIPTAAAREPTSTIWHVGRQVPGLASADRHALGTNVRVVIWPPEDLRTATVAVDEVLGALDAQASRFRPDSEISRLEACGGGLYFVSPGLAEALQVALVAARWTGGLVDPTVGATLCSLGYDRDFASLDHDGDGPLLPTPAPGWRSIALTGRLLQRGPDVRLDLGATAKGLGADRAARAALAAAGGRGGVLVSLGGDLGLAGAPPLEGWPILVTDDEATPESGPSQVVRLCRGGLATSSTTTRRWRRGGRELHHLVDPSTGLPAAGPWRTVSVAAPSCAEANAAATAALVAGPGDLAENWLRRTGLPARLVAHDGSLRLLGGWPAIDGATIDLAGVAPGPVTRAAGGAW